MLWFIFWVLARAVTDFRSFLTYKSALRYKSTASLVACRATELSLSLQVSRCEKFGYGVMMTQVAATAPGVMALNKSGNVLLPCHRFWAVFSLFFFFPLPLVRFKSISHTPSTHQASSEPWSRSCGPFLSAAVKMPGWSVLKSHPRSPRTAAASRYRVWFETSITPCLKLFFFFF